MRQGRSYLEHIANSGKMVNSRSFVVRLEGGRTFRRNRHQLQLRPGPIQFQEEEDGLEEPKVEGNEPEKQEDQGDQGDQQQQAVQQVIRRSERCTKSKFGKRTTHVEKKEDVRFGLMLSCVGGLAYVSIYGTSIRYTGLVLALGVT